MLQMLINLVYLSAKEQEGYKAGNLILYHTRVFLYSIKSDTDNDSHLLIHYIH